jgi:hypothetical protein
MGWGALRDLGAVGRRLGDLDVGFRVPVTVDVRTPTYSGEARLELAVAKGQEPGLRLRVTRPVATAVEGVAGETRFELDVTVDGAGLWLTARPVGAGAPRRALALSLPVTGVVEPPPRKRRRRRGAKDVQPIDGGFRVNSKDGEGRPVRLELLHDEGHWPRELRIQQGEERSLVLRFGTFVTGPPSLEPPLPAGTYTPLDMVGAVRLLPLWKDLGEALGPVPLGELFPAAPGEALIGAGELSKISLGKLARGEKLGFAGLLKLASVLDEEELLTGLREGIRKLRGALARSWAPPKRRGILGRFRR